MIRNLACALWIATLASLVPVAGIAQQDAPVEGETAAPANIDGAPAFGVDQAFERLAVRAEELAASEDVSLFSIGRLRSELVVWRDQFLHDATVNSGRLATVNAQIAALGPVPESGDEPQAVAARRDALIAQRQELRAPRLLAQEAHARANGIIGEFDMIVLQRDTAELSVRSPSPLNPTHVLEAGAVLWGMIASIGIELRTGVSFGLSSGALLAVMPRAFILFVVGVGLLGAGRRVVTQWRNRLALRDGRWQALQLFLLSVVQICVPFLGVLAVAQALTVLNVFGIIGRDVLASVPAAGGSIIFGWWLARHLFPLGDASGYLGYDIATRATGRGYTTAIAWVFALVLLTFAGLQRIEMTPAVSGAVAWPFLATLGFLFWRLGSVIRTVPEPVEDKIVSVGRMRGYVGRMCQLVGIAAPVIAAFGFVAAGRALLIPTILSAALLGVLLLMQRIGQDISRPLEDDTDKRGLFALLPVFISFVLFLASLPVFALIWGARVDDLLELWTRFREGFAVGETRISPGDFAMFAAVFATGYLLTRFIQGTLRKSVMPRTRLDLGGQNAVVAGFGYVGIILAAIVSITSAGIDLSNLAIVAGALSVGIGFGLQNIVSNFVSGIILLIERPVSEGDWIEVGGQMGYVRAISVRSTRIETFDRTDVIIPNADLVSGQVTNWTRGNLVGRVIVPVGVAYGTDVDKVTEILRGIAEAHPLVIMTPPPAVLFTAFGADSLDFEIRAILRDVNYVLVTKSEMNHEIATQFAAAGIEIPFAQRDIWLRNPEALKGTS